MVQDSLGGNAKTMIIANVSPSATCAAETVSTLNWVSQAKCIRNKATINLNYRGDVAMLQKEIVRLNTELDHLRRSGGGGQEASTACPGRFPCPCPCQMTPPCGLARSWATSAGASRTRPCRSSTSP